MRIRFNNFFKVRRKEKSIHKKEPVFKVYSGGGKVIKYEPNKMNNGGAEYTRRRSGATQEIFRPDFGRSSEVVNDEKSSEMRSKIIKKCSSENLETKKKDEKISVKKRRRGGNKNANILFLFMLILAGYSLYFSYNRYNELNEEDYAVYNSEEVKEQVIIPEEQSSISNNLDTIETKAVITNSTNELNTTNKTQVQKVTPLSFAKPLEGEILKIYSSDKVIYSKTLELWKTHDGIDIKADENTIVKSIEKGTVEKIYDDSFYGKTIVIDHGQGYKSSYSNLSDEVFVKEKQVVTKLAKIGKVGKTAIGEIKDEPHLHFTLIKNNEICDPSSIFK